MADYMVIADTSKTILELLRRNLVPEPLAKIQDIGLCTPDDRGDYTLGLCLYHMDENAEIRQGERVYFDKEHYLNPPTTINLYYMLFVHSESEVISRAVDEQRIMGKAMQIINDNSRIESDYLCGVLADGEAGVEIANDPKELSDASRVFELYKEKIHLARFYKVGPVYLDMKKVRTVQRVKTAEIELKIGN